MADEFDYVVVGGGSAGAIVAAPCRMPADDDIAAVDRELRVRGIEGLWIADGSAFPSMPTVDPVVGTFMVGEKAADLVRAR